MVYSESLIRPNDGGIYIFLNYEDKPCEPCARCGQALAERIGHSICKRAGMGKSNSKLPESEGKAYLFKKGSTEKIATAGVMAEYLKVETQSIYRAKAIHTTIKGWTVEELI